MVVAPGAAVPSASVLVAGEDPEINLFFYYLVSKLTVIRCVHNEIKSGLT